ncbi:chorismate-binding protein, partial [Asticcacaulis sp.]|uniref:chorismate-binding protein n=1 Tax=Asticcacaulis sp. TaxID=1872648 RepID=UPI00262F3AFD
MSPALPEYLHILSLPYRPPETFFGSVLRSERCAGFLSDGGALGRWSWLCVAPDDTEVFTFDEARHPEEVLRTACAQVLSDSHIHGDDITDLPPFTGGLIGLAGFELGPRLENLSLRAFHLGAEPWPELVLMRFSAVLAFDLHHKRRLVLGRGATPEEARQRAEALAAQVETAAPSPLPASLMDDPLLSETPDAEFEAKVATLVAQIHAGDLFQANLARGWRGALTPGLTPDHILQALAEAGASPFGAFMRFGDRAVVSNSPERFIRLEADGR